ncbi:DinB family protein [Nocardioides euryhalodurans]|uniref:DinB family protein n=1 Tax=Nocardioides euryhalodurans TaxID=2518370 RepID=A0A4P7GGL6_9ACTN|nr:DinB family protein [Nocardioides euryhalodurans]QBR90975.1 DinB family protein [Nocardioides euryhalodurans]
MRRFDDEDLTGAEFRECDLSRARMVGVVMQDAEIDGLVTSLVVNGVEVMPYVEAELDRRHPVRLLIRSDRPADLREAWRQLRDDWATTTERVRSMPENSEHRGVDGEWSMVETLRHLVFVHDTWFRRCVLGLTEPFTAMGLGPPDVMDRKEDGLDRSARPSLDEVLAVRSRQASEIEAWLAEVTADQLTQTAPVPDDDRWPPYATGRTVRKCLGTVLDEEWAHHGFCKRDLDKLTRQHSPQG